jgi:hypothetical protein
MERAPQCPPRWILPIFNMNVLKLLGARSKVTPHDPVQATGTKQTRFPESDEKSAAISTELKSQGFPILVAATSLFVRPCGVVRRILGSVLVVPCVAEFWSVFAEAVGDSLQLPALHIFTPASHIFGLCQLCTFSMCQLGTFSRQLSRKCWHRIAGTESDKQTCHLRKEIASRSIINTGQGKNALRCSPVLR